MIQSPGEHLSNMVDGFPLRAWLHNQAGLEFDTMVLIGPDDRT
jgi:hypothetical protein